MKNLYVCIILSIFVLSCSTPTMVLVHKQSIENNPKGLDECLNVALEASKQAKDLPEEAKRKLKGIDTTEFLYWGSLSGPKIVINPEYKLPSQRKSLIPAALSSKLVSDIYVLCLIKKGYEFHDKSELPSIYKKKYEDLTSQIDKNDPEVYYDLAILLEEGWGVNRDMGKAIEYYTKSAELNYTLAEYYLGVIYDKGRGVEPNKEKAFQLYMKAAKKGFAYAQFNLGICYRRGWGTSKDENKAVEWLNKAKESGVQ